MKVRSVLPKILTHQRVAAHIFQRPGISGPAGWSRPSVSPCSCPVGLSCTFPPFFSLASSHLQGMPPGPSPSHQWCPLPMCVCEQGSTCLPAGLVSLATAPHRCATFLSFFVCLHGLKGQRGGCSSRFSPRKKTSFLLLERFKSNFQDTNLFLSQQSARRARSIPGLETWVLCLVLCDGASLGLFLSFFICNMEEQLCQPVRVDGRIV